MCVPILLEQYAVGTERNSAHFALIFLWPPGTRRYWWRTSARRPSVQTHTSGCLASWCRCSCWTPWGTPCCFCPCRAASGPCSTPCGTSAWVINETETRDGGEINVVSIKKWNALHLTLARWTCSRIRQTCPPAGSRKLVKGVKYYKRRPHFWEQVELSFFCRRSWKKKRPFKCN